MSGKEFSSAERERLAFELMKLTSYALRELNSGIEPIPKHWETELKECLGISKDGPRQIAEKKQRDIEIATKAIDYKISLSQWKDAGRTIDKKDAYTKYLTTLADEYGFTDVKNIYRAIRIYKAEALQNFLLNTKRWAAFLAGMSLLADKDIPEDIRRILKDFPDPEESNLEEIQAWIENGKAKLES